MRDEELLQLYHRQRSTRLQRRRRRSRKLLILTLVLLLAVLILVVYVRADAEKQMAGKLEKAAAPTVPFTQTLVLPEADQVNDAYDTPAAEPVTYHEPNPVDVIAKAVYGEAGICSTTEQAAVVWCICNRVDAGYGDLVEVTTASGQFHGYDEDNPVDPDIESLVQDVLIRWRMEESCIGSVGRVLPKEYLWFHGDGEHNYFRSEYQGGERWNWSLPSPYEERSGE